jgi:MFS family permease
MTQVEDAATSAAAPAYDVEAVQRRTIRTLLTSQVAGGMGLVSGYTVTALLADDLTGSKTLAGFSAACLSIGASIGSFPLARMMSRSGRRPGLRTGYLIAALGSMSAVMAAVTGFFWLLPLGVAGIGVGNATNMATRYAAADLAAPERRAKTIGLVVQATTLGSGIGSLVSLSLFDPLGRSIGLPDFGGSYLMGALLFLVGAAVVEWRLRPDPLVVAGGVGVSKDEGRLPLGAAMGLILANPKARLAVLGLMISQATMVGTMTLTPLHMKDGGLSNTHIAIMMFSHILGMYAFSPLIGSMTDRVGRYPMLLTGGVTCAVASVWAGLTPGDGFYSITGALTLNGLAWCFGIIAASGLLTESFPVQQRASVQGAGDLCMAAFGATAGISAGFVVAARSYRDLNFGTAALGVVLVLATLWTMTRRVGSRPAAVAATATA